MGLRSDIDTGAERIGESVVSELPEDDVDASERIDAVLVDLEDVTSELRGVLAERLPLERRASESEPPRASD